MGKFIRYFLAFLGIAVFVICGSFFTQLKEVSPFQFEQSFPENQKVTEASYLPTETVQNTNDERLMFFNDVRICEAYTNISDKDLYLKIRDVGMALIFLIAILGSLVLFFLWKRAQEEE